MAELLVRHGASVNVADLWKFTPLHEAAAKGKYEICKLLLKVRIIISPGESVHDSTSGILWSYDYRFYSTVIVNET